LCLLCVRLYFSDRRLTTFAAPNKQRKYFHRALGKFRRYIPHTHTHTHTHYPYTALYNTAYSRRIRWAGHVPRMEEKGGVYRILVGELVEKRPFGRPKRRWENNIKMDLQEVGCRVYGLDRAGSG